MEHAAYDAAGRIYSEHDFFFEMLVQDKPWREYGVETFEPLHQLQRVAGDKKVPQ